VGASVVAGVEIRLLGPLTVSRAGAALVLPGSRKVRGLLAYLALAPHPIARSQLCELLWDVPNDPRGELRWCLSKIRGLVDASDRRRVRSQAELVALDVSDCFVDALEVARMCQAVDALSAEQLRALVALFDGDVLDGLEIDGSPGFNGWLVAQRRRFRGFHTALLEQLVSNVSGGERRRYLEAWLELAPFDRRAHELLLDEFAQRNGIREGEEHLAVTIRLFEAEGLDGAPLREAWRSARSRGDGVGRDAESGPAGRASVAVMPFVDRMMTTGIRGRAADALVYDVITRLAKLRSLFVIAQGTVFALHERGIGPEDAARMLSVDYVVSGSVRQDDARLTVAVELTETRTARIVWTEVFDRALAETFDVLEDLGNRIVGAIASEIEASERNRAVLTPPSSLNAWEAYHRGLWHMYRFNEAENEHAKHFFELAVRLDPTFARAYAGLSFTHFQNAFQGWAERQPEVERALASAGQSLMVDDRDPAAHWAMGRALWLHGRNDASVVELEQAVDLSPNFALGHYTLAFVHAQGGDPETAISASDYARHLSPFDPLLFGMLASRGVALARLGRFDEAAEWGIKAAGRPNAHAHILGIAAFLLALAGRHDEARAYLATIHKTRPQYGIDDFLRAFQFERGDQQRFRDAAKRINV